MSLFVGNVHRFCSHYLFDNNVVARDTTVIDEQEALSIMASIFGWDEGSLANNGNKRILTNAIKLQHLGYMIANGCPKEFLLHTDLFRTFDYKTLFKLVSLDYTMENFAGLYNGTVFPKVETSGRSSQYLDDCLQQFRMAREYQQYKEERNLVDFDDLLILTYIHASQHQDRLKKYSWIQIDEVQDLSPFQFGIIDLFTDRSKENVTLYLGDEQQAIFSFIGAKLATLEWLRERCVENMHRLYFNYRSPKYLLDVFNTYANMELDVDPHFLPKTNNLTEAGQDSICIMSAPERMMKQGWWLKVLAVSVPLILMKGWPFWCLGIKMQTRFPVNSPTGISPTSRFPEQTFSLPVRCSCFCPSAGGVYGIQHDVLVKDPDRDRNLQ